MTTRVKDSYQKPIYEFITDVLVVCPSCNEQAIVKSPGYIPWKDYENDIKLICTKCGYNKMLSKNPKVIAYHSKDKLTSGKHYYIGGAVDPFFHIPLWLMTNCCGHALWAYNYEHLNFLYKHVEAKLRERNAPKKNMNRSVASRLPRWMTSTKNREVVLKAIEALKGKNIK